MIVLLMNLEARAQQGSDVSCAGSRVLTDYVASYASSIRVAEATKGAPLVAAESASRAQVFP